MVLRYKVLVASPVYEGMEYCLNDFIEHLKQIDYSNFKTLLVDNSETKHFFRKLNQILGIKAIYDDTSEEKNMRRLISSRNKILDYAIKENYDYLLMMDCDVMVPRNIINSLLLHEKDVCSGLYFNIFQVDGGQKLLPVAYKEFTEEQFQGIKQKFPEIIKSRTDLRFNITKEDIEKGELLEVLYPSAGCLMLSRKAFASGARYGLLDTQEKLKSSDDIYFIKELRKRGFKIYCDPNLICKHDIFGKLDKQGNHPAYR